MQGAVSDLLRVTRGMWNEVVAVALPHAKRLCWLPAVRHSARYSCSLVGLTEGTLGGGWCQAITVAVPSRGDPWYAAVHPLTKQRLAATLAHAKAPCAHTQSARNDYPTA